MKNSGGKVPLNLATLKTSKEVQTVKRLSRFLAVLHVNSRASYFRNVDTQICVNKRKLNLLSFTKKNTISYIDMSTVEIHEKASCAII